MFSRFLARAPDQWWSFLQSLETLTLAGVGIQGLYFRPVNFESLIRQPKGHTEQVVNYIRQEYRGEVKTEDINLEIISIQMVFESMNLDKITQK